MPNELEPTPEEQGEQGAPNRWKYPVSALIVMVGLGLTVYVTYRTGEIPYTVFGPLLGAALWGLLGFRASDWRK